MKTRELRDCVVLLGPELEPWHCARFAWAQDTITTIERISAVHALERGTLVVIPGLYNGHTHLGDAALPDGATGLTLEQGFFRPDGFKYRELAKLSSQEHLPHVIAHLRYLARTGTVCHIDFREQGRAGAELLRAASDVTGVESIILSQLRDAPFSEAALDANTAPLPSDARVELDAMLDVADGFSESTMNDLTDPAWQVIRAVTEQRGKLRAVHCLENAGYRDASVARTGRGDLERAIALLDPHLVVHLTAANDAEIAMLAVAGKTAVINPRANATLGLALPRMRALLDAGVNLLLGTDNVMLNSPNLLAELDFTYRLAKSQYGDAVRPDPRTILRMVTSNIRAALGGDHHGALGVGWPATFAVLNFHQPHLRSTRHLAASVVARVTPEDVLATYRAGRELYRAAELVG